MHPYTKAIEVFEEEALKIRQEYDAIKQREGNLIEEEIMERDRKLERCLWAINVLDEAYKKERC